MRQNLLFTIGVVALLGAGAIVSMQDPPKPVPVDWVTVEFNAENCDTDGFDVSWRTDYSSGVGGYVVTGVQLSRVTWFCLKQDITVYLNSRTDGTGGTVLAYATVDGSTGVTSTPYEQSVFFDFGDAHVAAQAINGIAVSIPDRADSDTFAAVRDASTRLATATLVYGRSVYLAGQAVRGATDITGVQAAPAGGMIFWYCYGASALPATCREGSAGSVAFSDPSTGVGLTAVAGALTPTAIADSTTQTPPAAGYYLYRVRFVTSDYTYYGSEDSGGSGGVPIALTVTRAPTTVTLSRSASTITWGQPVTLTGVVNENVAPPLTQPTGTIYFSDQGGPIGSCTVVNNTCSYTTTALKPLAAGTRSIVAKYGDVVNGGDSNYLDSPATTAQNILVYKANTTTTLEVASSSLYLSPLTITARVATPTGGIPSGASVSFRDYTSATATGYTTLGSCTTVADATTAICSITIGTLAVRDHYLRAFTSATANLNSSSTATPSLVTVLQPTTTTTVTASPVDGTRYGELAQFTATVASNGGTVPAATVTFTDTTSGGSRALGSCTLSGGICSISTTTLDVTTHTIVASYPGASSIPASTSDPLAYVVSKAGSTTTISASTTSVVVGQSLTYTARVAPVLTGAPTPTGDAWLYENQNGSAVQIGLCTLASGSCTVTTSFVSAGSKTLWFTYQGSSRYAAASSATTGTTVLAASTTLTSSWSPASPVYGQDVTLTAVVAPVSPGTGTPTGTVTFSDGTTTIGSCTLVDRTCSVTWTRPTGGSHTLKYWYLGSADYKAVTVSRAITIAAAPTTTELTAATYASRTITVARNASLTFTAKVSSTVGAPTGSVTFRMTSSTGANTTLGTVTLAAAGATWSTGAVTYKFTKAGTYYVTVGYTSNSTSYTSSTLPTASRYTVTVQ